MPYSCMNTAASSGRELGDLHFEFALQRHRRRLELPDGCVLSFAHVENDQHRFAREQPKTGEDFTLLRRDFHLPQRGIVGERLAQALKEHGLAFVVDFIGAALFAFLRQAFELAFHGDQIIQQQLAEHDICVPRRIDAAHRVQDAVILEAACHQDKAVHLGQLVQQLTGDAALRRAAFQPGDIRIGHFGVDRLFRLEHRRELVHARVGDIHHRRMDFERPAEAVVGAFPRVNALKMVVLPDWGSPMIPSFILSFFNHGSETLRNKLKLRASVFRG